MSNTRGYILASIMGMALGVYLGTSMRGNYTTHKIRSSGRHLFRRARNVVEDGVGSWLE